MEPVADERREFQRLLLDPPIDGSYNGADVEVVEIGILGARLRHKVPLDEYGELRVERNDGDVVMRCQIVRSASSGSKIESGLRFTAALDGSGERFRALLYDLVSHELEERRNITLRRLAPSSIDGDRTVRGKDASFISYRFENDTWKKRSVFLPEQPATGFTVSRFENAEEMQLLCHVYQASDDEGRRLIRLFAELSISAALDIPPAG